MKRCIVGCLLFMVFATGSFAAPAVFKDSVLTIDEGIVIEGDESTYYTDIRLGVSADGDFKLLEADRKNPAHVDEISVAVLETSPAQVEVVVIGYKSTPCVELEYAVAKSGTKFHIVVAENPLQTLVACIQVIEPFELSLPLDVVGLPAGEYQVNVNGHEVVFTL